MIPLAHAAEATGGSKYLDVFQSTDFGVTVAVCLLSGLGLLIVATTLHILKDMKKQGKEVFTHRSAMGKLAVVLAVVACVLVFGPIGFQTGPENATIKNMALNVKEKYNAELQPISSSNAADRFGQTLSVDQPKQYTLTFPNGAKATYTIQFDKATNEPFIIDPNANSNPPAPTVQELNAKH